MVPAARAEVHRRRAGAAPRCAARAWPGRAGSVVRSPKNSTSTPSPARSRSHSRHTIRLLAQCPQHGATRVRAERDDLHAERAAGRRRTTRRARAARPARRRPSAGALRPRATRRRSPSRRGAGSARITPLPALERRPRCARSRRSSTVLERAARTSSRQPEQLEPVAPVRRRRSRRPPAASAAPWSAPPVARAQVALDLPAPRGHRERERRADARAVGSATELGQDARDPAPARYARYDARSPSGFGTGPSGRVRRRAARACGWPRERHRSREAPALRPRARTSSAALATGRRRSADAGACAVVHVRLGALGTLATPGARPSRTGGWR